jgi:hypothetical protein
MALKTTARPLSEYGLISDNRLAVEVLLDYTGLPAPTLIPRPDAVFVVVADVDDLEKWLDALGGRIHISSAADGLELWTLLTQTEPRGDGSRVEVRVSVPVPMGSWVQDAVRQAVAA